MGVLDFFKGIFGGKEEALRRLEGESGDKLTLASNDLIKMAEKLVGKGEYYRAEQVLRDGVQDGQDNIKLWQLLLDIEEELGREGRIYYCYEQIIRLNPEIEMEREKYEELKEKLDQDMSLYIEYRLAPEFYKLK